MSIVADTRPEALTALNRRGVLRAGFALLVSFSTSALPSGGAQAATATGNRPPLTPDQLDSFIALRPDGDVVAFFGKVDVGQGLDIAIRQIVAEELDVPISAVSIVQGDTAQTVDQGGASGSYGIEKGAIPLRFAAAEARRILVERAAGTLSVSPGELITQDGFVRVKSAPHRGVAYKDLVGKDYFETPLEWNGKTGNLLASRGKAQPKSPADYKVVGQSIPRTDIRDNVFGQQTYVTDVRLPGMLHARVIRPPVVGAEPVAIDETSVKDIRGVRIVHERALLAVLAEKEWDAIRAAAALGVTWTKPENPLIDQSELYAYLRTAPALARKEEIKKGDMAAAFAGASRTIAASYEWPFQSHASMSGACAVADVKADEATIWTGTQKPHAAQAGVAKLLNLPLDKVHAVWTRGPGSYGRNDAGDAAIEAAYLSRAAGRPVRLQYTRGQGTGWDPKGPASVHLCKAAVDEDGNVLGHQVESRGFSRYDVAPNEADPRDTLPGQLLGLGSNPKPGFAVPQESYEFVATLLAWETVPALAKIASPLRTAHLRDPLGPQMNFASESFIDELAVNAKTDPVAFRLRYLKDARAVAVLKAAAERFGWDDRPAAAGVRSSQKVRGRGIALAQRLETLCAVAVEIELDRETGVIRPVRWVLAHDCGLIVNPATLRLTLEGNILQATSRALHEEVTFDREKVTSVDWVSYPILDSTETPDLIDIVLINRPDIPPAGAGEAATRPVAAAIANAVFDATGVRLRRAPFTAARVKAALT